MTGHVGESFTTSTSYKDLGINSPAQKPLSGVLESNNCPDHYPVARPSLYLLFT